MCEIRNDWSMEEVINHPKLSDDFKINYFFELTLQEDFYGLLNSLGLAINDIGLTIGDIDNLDYIWDINAEDDKLIVSKTDAFENEDETTLYRYISTEVFPSFVSSETNAFCQQFVKRTNDYLMSKEDMQKLKNKYYEKTDDGLFNFGTRDNCSHMFVKYKYNNKTKKLLKSNQEQFSRVEFKKWRADNIQSSNVKKIMYNDETKEMFIQFQDKSIYTYFGVDFNLFLDVSGGKATCITSGENKYGKWFVGKTPSVGAAVHKFLIKKGIKYQKGGSLR